MIEGVFYESVKSAAEALGLWPTVVKHRVLSSNEKFADWYYSDLDIKTNLDWLKMQIDLRTKLTPAPHIKLLINLGALLDIPTGHYVEGRRGEMILVGGLAPMTGIVGIGNNFKSTLMHFMMLQAMSRMKFSAGKTYDTEVNIHEWHLASIVRRTEAFHGEDVIQTQRWSITDKTMYIGDEWYSAHKKELDDKSKRKDIIVNTPFWNRDRQGAMTMMIPTFTEMDSFTEFETSDVVEMQEHDLGDSKGNTIHMRQGLAKTRILMEAPRIHGSVYDYLLMTAHLGKETTMQNAGPAGSVPIVKLKHLKNGDKIKGTTDRFTFVTHNCWHAFNATPLINQSTKAPEYPRHQEDDLLLDTDLNTLQIRNLRSKSGASGMALTLIVSQSEGVLPALTEFHHIKDNEKYGIEGSNVSYSLSLVPEVKLGRTTVRAKIDADPKLRRALNITSEMCQMSYLWHTLPEGLLCSPKELYDDLKTAGYEWNTLLETRGWWTHEYGEKDELPFLSTMDLLRMRRGLYHPYWLEADKKTVKPEYQKANPYAMTELEAA